MSLKKILLKIILTMAAFNLFMVLGHLMFISADQTRISKSAIFEEYDRIIHFHTNDLASNISMGMDDILNVFLTKISKNNRVNIMLRTDHGVYSVDYFKPSGSSVVSKNFKLDHAGRQLGDITLSKELPPLTGIYLRRIFNFILFLVVLNFMGLLYLYRWSKNQILLPFSKAIGLAQNGEYFDGKNIPMELKEILISLKKAIFENKNKQNFEGVLYAARLLAHDVKKPLVKTSVVFDILSESKNISQVHELLNEYRPQIEENKNNISKMLDELIELGTPDGLDINNVLLSELISSSVKQVFLGKDNIDISFIYDFEPGQCIFVDKLKFHRVFCNIIGNAVDAMRGKGRIEFKVIPVATEQICISIFNSNSKIDEEDLDKIFSPKFTKNKKNGTGLGLSSVQKIVADHKGSVRASNQEDGVSFQVIVSKGTVAHIPDPYFDLLPTGLSCTKAPCNTFFAKQAVIDIDTKSAPSQAYNILTKSSYKLFLVDDESIYYRSVKALIESNQQLHSSIQLFYAAGSESCIEMLSREQFDLCLCDVDLDSELIDGFDIAALVSEKNPNCYIVIHSNRSQFGNLEMIERCGANEFLAKPISLNDLLRLLALACKRRVAISLPDSHQTWQGEIRT